MAEMKRKKDIPKTGVRVMTTAAVLCMAVGLSITANAAGTDQNNGKDSGKTTVRLGVAKAIPEPVSFEVPLYYTAAIVKTDPADNNGRRNKVVYPDGYYIKNLYEDSDIHNEENLRPGKGTGKELVVADIQVSSVKGATWDIVDSVDGVPGTDKKMTVTLGGVPLPAVKKESEVFKSANLTNQSSVFYDQTKTKYLFIGDSDGDEVINGDRRTDIDLKIEIPAEYEPVGNGPTVAQFKVVYTLTTRNNDGTLIGHWDQAWVDRNYIGPKK